MGGVFHYGIGNAGHLAVLASFVFALFGLGAGVLAHRNKGTASAQGYGMLARAFGWVHVAGVVIVAVLLFTIIKAHYFEYGYAWSHSSLHLDPKYMIACFWEGQEGSFLLWAFWNALIIGIAGLWFKKFGPVAMAVMLGVQAVLCSMLLGVDLFGLTLGSSPFVLMRDMLAGQAPVFKLNPEYIPSDGRGLNPLLQNYWNIIHPPTLFLGFALGMVPYAYSVAGLAGEEAPRIYKKNALILAAAVLGTGIMMGAYWAYETLNFGGYWNWDPVENGIYIPWLVLVAALHGLLLPRSHRNGLLLDALIQTSFLLVLYSTFLTRSGILGETSVHSFTDLGLSGQLLFFLFGFLGLSLLFLGRGVARLPKAKADSNAMQWLLLCGIATLLLASFQVLATTSIPVVNAIGKWLGQGGRLAPPANPIQHYTKWQIWFAVATLVLSAFGQLFWRVQGDRRSRWLQALGAVALVGAAAVVMASPINNWVHIVLLAAGLFAFGLNAAMLLGVRVPGTATRAGALAHVGLAVMVLGILFSAGYSKVISINNSGLVYRKEFSTEMNRDNVLLWRGKPTTMGPYQVAYNGPRTELAGTGALVSSDSLQRLGQGYRALALGNLLSASGHVLGKRGDTVAIRPENTYYQVSFIDTAAKKSFFLYPRAQANPSMGLLASPDIRITPQQDLYTHVSSIPSPGQEQEYDRLERSSVAIGGRFFAQDYVAHLEAVTPVTRLDALPDLAVDAAVRATITVEGPQGQLRAQPVFVIKGNEVGRLPADIKDLSLRFTIEEIDPKTGLFTIGCAASQQDWIILKAVEKPFVSLVWGGFLIMTAGFVLAIKRRRGSKAEPIPTGAGVLERVG